MYATLLDDPDMINRQLDRYLAVTPADIQAVSARVFRPDNRVVLTYVPAPAGDVPAATGGAPAVPGQTEDEESVA
jgi:predicted Zn-dependent peptidase